MDLQCVIEVYPDHTHLLQMCVSLFVCVLVHLPHGIIGCSVIGDCSIYLSYSLIVFDIQ